MRIDLATLRELEAQKFISIQQHPSLPLLIHNYTPVCQYSKAWNHVTLMCRGLITDLEGNVVARPFPKFFNLSEHVGHEASDHEGFRLPTIDWHQDFTALKKYDGSLGILYFDGDEPCLATRGSFTSEQAVRAKQILQAKGYKLLRHDDLTFLFEIIYPENRIVVDYGSREELVLLDVIDNETGSGCAHEALVEWGAEIGCPVVECLAATPEMLQGCAETNVPNEEGYVVRFEDGTRVKVKFAEYVRLHKLITGVNSKSIWENLASGHGVEELLDRVPDEFNAWVKQTVEDLQAEYRTISAFAEGLFSGVQALERENDGAFSRKQYALEFVKHQPYTSILFHLLDGKDPAPLIWKMIKPVSTKPFFSDPDA